MTIAPREPRAQADARAEADAGLSGLGTADVGAFPRRRSRPLASTLLHGGIAGLAAATLLAELGDQWWFADFFAHFRFQYIAVASALAALALALRRRALAAVACALIVPQLIVIAGVPVADRAQDAPPSQRIRIVTTNLQWSNTSLEALVAHFRNGQTDVIALQELTPAALPLIRALTKDYPYVAPADWEEQESGVVVLSRYPIEAAQLHRVPWSPIVEATVRHPAGTFRLFAVHAPYPMSPSLYELHQLYFDAWMRLTAQADLPVIIAGDFNLTPWSARFRHAWRAGGLAFTGDYRVWPKTWPAHATPMHYLPALLIGGIPIDHVLVSRHFAVAANRRGPYVGSDHYPVTSDLVLKR